MKKVFSPLPYISVSAGIAIAFLFMIETEAVARDPEFLPPGYVMKFERIGGYFGWDDKCWVYSDGRIFNSSGKIARIPSDSVSKWKEVISLITAPVSKASPLLLSVCMDCYRYRITVYDNGRKKVLAFIYPLTGDEYSPVKNVEKIFGTLRRLVWE